MKPNFDEQPRFSPSPRVRGALYTLCAVLALVWGHVSGERPLNVLKAGVLGLIAFGAGAAIAALQSWARQTRDKGQAPPAS